MSIGNYLVNLLAYIYVCKPHCKINYLKEIEINKVSELFEPGYSLSFSSEISSPSSLVFVFSISASIVLSLPLHVFGATVFGFPVTITACEGRGKRCQLIISRSFVVNLVARECHMITCHLCISVFRGA